MSLNKYIQYRKWKQEFEHVWDKYEGFAGESIPTIRELLEELGWTPDKILAFARFFIRKGMSEGWLYDEMGWTSGGTKISR